MDAGYEQWLAYQHDAVDKYVKHVNVHGLQQPARLELQGCAKQKQAIQAFHTDVATCTMDTAQLAKASKSAMHAGLAGRETPNWDYLKVCSFVGFIPHNSFVQPESWCVSAAFATVLQGFLQQQRWVLHNDGMSLLETYLHFVKITGWLVGPGRVCVLLFLGCTFDLGLRWTSLPSLRSEFYLREEVWPSF